VTGPCLRVLVVDDQPAFCAVARRLLVARGHEVVAEAADAASALEALARTAPDAVLLDKRLGSESGFDVARALIDARPGLPVVLVSTDDAGVCEAWVRGCGARGFVLKPDLLEADLEALWRAA
jgi:CheY-like chemotaxis protein